LQFLDTYEAERDIADTLVALKKEPLLSEGAIKNINEWEGLNQAQTEAFKAVARQRLTIISGRAGTGKSHTVRELVRWLACLGLRVFCVSPYHRTVERLRELGIHKCCTATSWRLQSGKPTKEKRAGALCTPEQCLFESTGGKWCLDCGADVIVLDESGIASTHDMAALLRWVSIRDRRLVLVGDTNQQQPIVGGSAISGIIHVCPETVVTLQTVQRVDAHSFHLLDLADAILRGDPTVPERVVFVYGFQDIWPLFSVHRSVVVTHNSKDADEINHLLAARHFASLKRRGRRCERHAKFFYGEMVCVTRGEANGTVGALVATKKLEIPKNETTNETTMVDGAEISIRGKYTIDVPMDALAPGYAATLNQVQGSEFEQVFVVINSAGLGYYGTKRWLYTACTRAKKNLFFVTDALADRAMYSRALSNPCADLSCSTLIPNLFNQNEVSIESVPPWVPEFQPSEFHDYRLALEIGENEPNYESFIGFLRNHVNFLA
jgi:ATP-dependent exoDNAse (exonuclease V) alpha subunit